ncbi:SRPBCC domain-containing protein [Nonomuraea sp. NEAU-A123]|uniref:SRPBCC domain-containing protein n=1 Tax=Nonomuraea sp. NEAU-A123 TaxID=2839649 RepID=UPI001BE49CFA|nr:SRPBCC domain-containing protein [Nonomuraea sp. NEAU-A123]MBT2227530.1 SRPBCC domain-containing protein [Nonomuraea sp. NEAU-A123]
MNSVQAAVTVPVDQATAFRVFTDEIDSWYVRGPHSWVDPSRAVGIRFEDGFLRELWSDGGHVDTGRILVWEPPRRLVWADLINDQGEMEIEVAFSPVDGGTEVLLEHRGLDTLPPDVAGRIRRGYSWQIALRWFAESFARL